MHMPATAMFDVMKQDVRRKEFEEVIGFIKRNQPVVIVAQNRMGKSSILRAIGKVFKSIYVSFDSATSLDLFQKALGSRIRILHIESIKSAEQLLEDKDVVLVFDELAGFGSDVLKWINNAAETHPRIVCGDVLSAEHFKIMKILTNFKEAALIYMKTYSDSDAEKVIVSPTHGTKVRYTSGAIKRIFELTNKLPAIIANFCENLIEHLRKTATKLTIDEETINGFLQEKEYYVLDFNFFYIQLLGVIGNFRWLVNFCEPRPAEDEKLAEFLVKTDVLEKVSGGYQLKGELLREGIKRGYMKGYTRA